MLRALFFDFDGLILDTETPEVIAWREIFAAHGQTFPDAWWQNAIGRGADQIPEFPEAMLERLAGVPVSESKAKYESRRMELIYAEPVRPGVVELLDLAQDRGLRCAVVSSSRHDWVDGHLTRLGLLSRFETTVCREDVPRAKPHPDLYIQAMYELGISASEGIVFEDSPNGVAAARAAGIYVYAVPNTLTAQLDLSAADHRLVDLVGFEIPTDAPSRSDA